MDSFNTPKSGSTSRPSEVRAFPGTASAERSYLPAKNQLRLKVDVKEVYIPFCLTVLVALLLVVTFQLWAVNKHLLNIDNTCQVWVAMNIPKPAQPVFAVVDESKPPKPVVAVWQDGRVEYDRAMKKEEVIRLFWKSFDSVKEKRFVGAKFPTHEISFDILERRVKVLPDGVQLAPVMGEFWALVNSMALPPAGPAAVPGQVINAPTK